MSRLKDLVGQRFGRLVVLERSGTQCGSAMWLCKCDCGNMVVSNGHNLRRGVTKSCGCNKSEATRKIVTTHGQSKTRLYRTWTGMKQRCSNPNRKAYKDYGGRGIVVCEEWNNSFEAFYDWAINSGYSDNLTIDRIDNDGSYCPENCRWVSRTEQANNKSTNNYITVNGETHTKAEWTKITGVSRATIDGRLKRGWTIEEALKKES